MSKFIPDVQIQSLRPMRAGDIAFANGGTQTIGVTPLAFAQPIVSESISIGSTNALEAITATPSESPVEGVAFNTLLSVDSLISISQLTTDALETLAGTPNESPVIGVAFGTSVV